VERLPVEDRFSYMVGWVDSDVAIVRNRKGERALRMGTSHLWQLAETHALFGWTKVVGLRMTLTLEGPKLAVIVDAPLKNLDEAIRRSSEDGWLKMLGIKAESWEGLKQRVAENWGVVVDAAVRRLGEGVRGELDALRDKLNDDKVAREVVAPALLLIQAERLGVNEATLRYFGAVVSGAIDGDGYVSATRKEVGLTSGKHAVALLWKAALAAHGIKTEVRGTDRKLDVVASGGGAARLAGLYFLYGPPLLEGDEEVINHKLAGAMELGAREVLSISWERLRQTDKGRVVADLTISEGGAAVKYNVYLRGDAVELQFRSTDRSRVELAARLLKRAGVDAEVKKEGSRDRWYIEVTTDRLAAGREELRKALAEIVRTARDNGWVDAKKAESWLEKLERGRILKEGWPKYNVRLKDGVLMVKYETTNSGNIEREMQRLENMGLVESVHFTVKMPEGGKAGNVSLLKQGLAYAARLSVHGRQRELAAEFVKYILERAWEAGEEVYEKAREIIKEGMSRGSLTLKGFAKRVEVGAGSTW